MNEDSWQCFLSGRGHFVAAKPGGGRGTAVKDTA